MLACLEKSIQSLFDKKAVVRFSGGPIEKRSPASSSVGMVGSHRILEMLNYLETRTAENLKICLDGSRLSVLEKKYYLPALAGFRDGSIFSRTP